VTKWRKARKRGNAGVSDDFPVELVNEDDSKSHQSNKPKSHGPSKKKYKDSKFGTLSGHKKGWKKNTADSLDDFSSHKTHFQGTNKSNNSNSKSQKSKRPGKRRRQNQH